MKIELVMQQVPPPDECPQRPENAALGLLPSLMRVRESDGAYRCCNCSRMQRPRSVVVFVPDTVRIDDPDWAVDDACRRMAYNGEFSGWCLKCAQKLGSHNSNEASLALMMLGLIAFIIGIIVHMWRQLPVSPGLPF